MNSVIYTLKTTSIVGKLEKDSNKKSQMKSLQMHGKFEAS